MMQIPILSNLLGATGLQPQPQAGGEAVEGGDAFAQLLALVPGQAGPTAPGLAPSVAALPVAVPLVAVDPALQPVLPADHSALVAAGTKAANLPHGQPGKTAPQTGNVLPLLLPTAETPLIAALPGDTAAPNDQAEAAPEGLSLDDLALLQNCGPQLAASAEMQAKAAKAAPAPERQLAASAAINLPLAIRPGKDRTTTPTEASSPAVPAETTDSQTAPSVVASVSLVRPQAARQTLAAHVFEPVSVQQPALQLAEPQGPSSEPSANVPAFEQAAMPDAELGTVIDRLVEGRMQSREGRSEVNLPHPDFGRVTLALSLAGRDTLSVAMPDAPPELRAAVGQAFTPPARTETASASATADSSFASGAEARSQDSRRDPQSSSGRGEPPRANTYGEQNRQFTTNRDNRRQANGRGVLA